MSLTVMHLYDFEAREKMDDKENQLFVFWANKQCFFFGVRVGAEWWVFKALTSIAQCKYA